MSFNYSEWLRKNASKTAELPEKTLREKKSPKVPEQISEVQLEGQRTDGDPALTEKRLEKVRVSASTSAPKTSPRGGIVRTAKKDETALPTETKLRKQPAGKIPEEISEVQLEGSRSDGDAIPTEARLEKVRTGAAELLTEGLLDKSGSKLVQHRNEKTSKGDINKVEEQRLAGKNVMEKEKYDPAAEDDKKLTFPQVKGKDGLRTAARPKPRMVEEYPVSGIPTPRIERTLSPEGVAESDYGKLLEADFPVTLPRNRRTKSEDDLLEEIDKLTSDIESPDPTELQQAETDIAQEGEESIPNFQVVDASSSDVGGTAIMQYKATFDPAAFANRETAEAAAAAWMKATFPELDIEQVEDGVIVDMDEGTVILSVPERER